MFQSGAVQRDLAVRALCRARATRVYRSGWHAFDVFAHAADDARRLACSAMLRGDFVAALNFACADALLRDRAGRIVDRRVAALSAAAGAS